MRLLRTRFVIISLAAALLPPAVLSRASDNVSATYVWRIPAWLPPPLVPDDNPMSEAKVELGRHLFYDKRLSADGSISCATCHDQQRAFTDGKDVGVAFDGTHGKRNPMGLGNVGYFPVLTWANPNLRRLEVQALVPIFGEAPIEMGMAGKEKILFRRLSADATYQGLFAAAFPERSGEISLATITRSLAAFQRTLISADSPYDRYKYGRNEKAISSSARRGEDLFFSHRLECYHCHSGFNFTDNMRHARSAFDEVGYHNNGLYNIGGRGAYPTGAEGLFEFTGQNGHQGQFRTPSLRNVAVTAPYMHDGSIATLDDVVRHYSRGGRHVRSGPTAGDGAKNPHKDPLVVGAKLSEREIRDLIAFLESLTDQTFLHEPRYSNPWKDGPNAKPLDRSVKHNGL